MGRPNAVVLTALVALAGLVAIGPQPAAAVPSGTTPARTGPAGIRTAATGPDGTASFVLGSSVLGRPIVAQRRAGAEPRHHLVVVGVIHGDEPAGRRVTDALLQAPLPDDVQLTVIASANPDGEAAGQRGNAHGVDLNRNFPAGWLPEGASEFTVGGYQPGPEPLSEPESAALWRWLTATRPDLTVWYHQPWGVVVCEPTLQPWCAPIAARLAMATEAAPRPGSAVSSGLSEGLPGLVIELPEGGIDDVEVERHVDALLGVFDQPADAPAAPIPAATGASGPELGSSVAAGDVGLETSAAEGGTDAVQLVARFANRGEGVLLARADFGAAGCGTVRSVAVAAGEAAELRCTPTAAGAIGWVATLTNPADGAVVASAAVSTNVATPPPSTPPAPTPPGTAPTSTAPTADVAHDLVARLGRAAVAAARFVP
ncbi:MAG: M14 family zinc carboxypeptidase [Acidimicrobiales bacterium]